MNENLKLAKAEYERFKLTWMLDHGFTLSDLIHELGQLREGSDPNRSMEALFADWEFECGFGSQIWPCFDEFLECEYREIEAARNSPPVVEPDKSDCERSVVAQLKGQPSGERKKSAPKKSAGKER